MPRTQDPNHEIDPWRRSGAGFDDREPDGDEARIGRAHPRDFDDADADADADADDHDGEPIGRAHVGHDELASRVDLDALEVDDDLKRADEPDE